MFHSLLRASSWRDIFSVVGLIDVDGISEMLSTSSNTPLFLWPTAETGLKVGFKSSSHLLIRVLVLRKKACVSYHCQLRNYQDFKIDGAQLWLLKKKKGNSNLTLGTSPSTELKGDFITLPYLSRKLWYLYNILRWNTSLLTCSCSKWNVEDREKDRKVHVAALVLPVCWYSWNFFWPRSSYESHVQASNE